VLQGGALTNKPFLNMAPVVNLARADAFATESRAAEPAADSRAAMPDMTPKILDALGLAEGRRRGQGPVGDHRTEGRAQVAPEVGIALDQRRARPDHRRLRRHEVRRRPVALAAGAGEVFSLYVNPRQISNLI
jgi:hypothetical protein